MKTFYTKTIVNDIGLPQIQVFPSAVALLMAESQAAAAPFVAAANPQTGPTIQVDIRRTHTERQDPPGGSSIFERPLDTGPAIEPSPPIKKSSSWKQRLFGWLVRWVLR